MIKDRVLILCVDRDDDLGRKAKISGPVIGKAANVQAATALLLSDPEDTDANAMFQAVKMRDELAKTKSVEIATITGDSKLGYNADKKVAAQLENVLQVFPASSCVFVTDGADDEEVLPIISSRLKIDSKRMVTMKQAKELEKTYVVLLSKLREPYYARLFFGIPAIILLAFLFSDTLGYGWRPIIAIVGLYLLLKGFGVEEYVISSMRGLLAPSSRRALIVYLPVLALAVISLSIGFSEFNRTAAEGSSVIEALSYGLRPILWPFMLFIIVLLLIGRLIELWPQGRKFETIDMGLYAVNGILVSYIAYLAAAWIVGDAWFSEFVVTTVVSIVIAAVAIEATRNLKTTTALAMKLEGKEAITEAGAYIGKIIGIDRKNGLAIAQTPIGSRIPLKLETIASVGERIIVKR